MGKKTSLAKIAAKQIAPPPTISWSLQRSCREAGHSSARSGQLVTPALGFLVTPSPE